MDVQVDGLGQIQAEDAHDGFGIDDITAGNQIKIAVEAVDLIDKLLDFVDRIEQDFYFCVQGETPLFQKKFY